MTCCVDELGYLDLDKPGAKLLFQVFTEREERRAIAIASNAPFSEWKQTFTDPRVCAALVDGVTFNVHIVATSTDSFRFAHGAAVQAELPGHGAVAAAGVRQSVHGPEQPSAMAPGLGVFRGVLGGLLDRC